MKAHDKQLWSYPNVTGFGVGYKVKDGKKLDHLSVIVFVKKKVPLSMLRRYEIIPPNIRGVLTDVQESGEIIAYAARTDKWRPAPPGVSIGHYLITAGTFGCVVLKNGVRKILSNNHVLANSNMANVGDAIYQPGVYDGGGPSDTMALLEDWVPIVFSPVANNLIDAATAAPINDDDILYEILDIGVPTDVIEAELDMSVVKSGRTTAVTYGTITSINATISVGYGPFGTARFIDQIITTKMLWPGDSGSLILTHPEHEAVGLGFAGSDYLSAAGKIQYAESLLGINILIDIRDAFVNLFSQFTVGQGQKDLPAQFKVGQNFADLSARFKVGQGFVELLGKMEIEHALRLETSPASSANLSTFENEMLIASLGSTYSFPTPFVELLAGFWVKQGSQDLLGKAVIRHEASTDLYAKFESQVIEDLYARFVVRQDSEDLFTKFDIQSSIDLYAIFEAQVTKDFFSKLIVRNKDAENLFFKLIVRNTDTAELYAKFEAQAITDLFSKFVIRQESTANLFSKFMVRQTGIPVELYTVFESQVTEELYAKLILRQDSEDLFTKFIVQYLADLYAKFEAQVTIDLFARFIVRNIGIETLFAELDVGQNSEDLFFNLVVRHTGFVEFFTKFEAQVSVDLVAKFITRHLESAEFFAEFIIQPEASADLYARFVTQTIEELYVKFEVGQGWESFPAEFIVGQGSTDLLSKFHIQPAYPLWTNRRYIEGVISLKETGIDDAILEYVIEGVMVDIQSWLVINELPYSFENIFTTPVLIRRATTYAAVATLFARDYFGLKRSIAVSMGPRRVIIANERDMEAAMEYWEKKMEKMLELYSSSVALQIIYVSTEDEEPVFSMENITK